MINIIRAHINDGMFPSLDKTLPGSDLLRKLWMFLANKTHRNRSHILKYAEKWFMTPLATADDFHSALRQHTALNTAKNILHHQLPRDINPDFVPQLLHGIRRNIDSAPIDIRHDMTTVVDELLRLAQPDVPLTASAITIALGSLYPDSPLSVPSKAKDDYAMTASVPSLRLVSSFDDDNHPPQAAFVAQTDRPPRRGPDYQPRPSDRQRQAPPRYEQKYEDSRSRPTSRNESRIHGSPPPDETLERLQKSFAELQSELARHKARNASAAKSSRPVTDRPKSYTASAMYVSSEPDPDTIDHQYALHARARFEADQESAREYDCTQTFDLPSDEDDF